jgi:hypothetical protein
MVTIIIIDDPHMNVIVSTARQNILAGGTAPGQLGFPKPWLYWNQAIAAVDRLSNAMVKLKEDLYLGVKRWLRHMAPLWVLFDEFERQTRVAALLGRRPQINLLLATGSLWSRRARPRQVHHGPVLLNFCKQ